LASGLRPEAIATFLAIELEGHWRRCEGGADIDLAQLLERCGIEGLNRMGARPLRALDDDWIY